jgi:predicted Zn-dependent peptidase
VGDVDPKQVEEIADRILPRERVSVGEKRASWPETMERPYETVTGRMEVAMPMFQLGFRCESAPNGLDSIRQEVVGDLAAEALFGESSALYLRLYEEGLIDSSFGGGFECLDGGSMLLCGGDSDEPEQVVEAILAEAERIAREGLNEEDFLRMKRSALGRRIRELDSFDSTCFRLCAYYLSDVDYFCFPEVYRQVCREEVERFLAEVVRSTRGAGAILYPIHQED